MSTKVAELFTINTDAPDKEAWGRIVDAQYCTYLERKCLKIRKSQPEISIGTCTVCCGKDNAPIVICPHRLLEGNQIFVDCLPLLTLHQPGNQYHVVSEVAIPGGSVDYFLVSARRGKIADFVGIELQTLDTSGTVWPERQRFLQSVGLPVAQEDVSSGKPFGLNWKMTAKTILVQLHHKVETFEKLNKHLVIVLQSDFLDYMRRTFSFEHIGEARLGHAMQFHSYSLCMENARPHLELSSRLSTDSEGVAASLGLQAESSVELEEIISQLEAKLSDRTLLSIFPTKTEEVSDIHPAGE
jgi:hypothetical protein